MASSNADETSLAIRSMNNSLFTYYLLEALQGKAHVRNDGFIHVLDVFDYVSEHISTHNRQRPIFKASDLDSNFPIALYLGGQQTPDNSKPKNAPIGSINKRALREAMARTFNEDELNVLCADIEEDMVADGLDLPVNLAVIGRPAAVETKILQLIEYLNRRGFLNYLIAAVQRLRPGSI